MTSPPPDIELVPGDRDKTKEELLTELEVLRHRIEELEETSSFPRNEAEHTQAVNALLRFLAAAASRQDYLGAATQLIQLWTGCRYVGIRVLNAQGDIPFEAYQGLSQDFWESENWLSIHRDQCVCIRVITGRPDAQDLGLMTRGGSFFVDNSLAFIDSLTVEQRRRFRGTCMRCGFRSIAVVPVVAGGKIRGVIHLADETAGKIDLNLVEFLEEAGLFLGQGLEKFNGGQELASLSRINLLMERSQDCLCLLSVDGRLLGINAAGCVRLRADRPDGLVGAPFAEVMGAAPEAVAPALAQAAGGQETGAEYQGRDRLGRSIVWETTFVPMRQPHGSTSAILVISRDISRRLQGG